MYDLVCACACISVRQHEPVQSFLSTDYRVTPDWLIVAGAHREVIGGAGNITPSTPEPAWARKAPHENLGLQGRCIVPPVGGETVLCKNM
jgi:hypothetical protein